MKSLPGTCVIQDHQKSINVMLFIQETLIDMDSLALGFAVLIYSFFCKLEFFGFRTFTYFWIQFFYDCVSSVASALSN